MLDRLVKVITNKPTNITKPIFTKDFDDKNKEINELEKLLTYSNENNRKYIERDIKLLKYGQIGEKNIYFELKNSFIPMVCLHDLRIEYKGLVAQIDFMVLTSKYIYVIECKNMIGNITVTDKGEFIRYKKDSYGKNNFKEGMYSPIVQNERHINVLKELLKDKLGYKNKLTRIKSLIVTANPNTIINTKYAPGHIKNSIIRHDQLIDFIKDEQNNRKIDWLFIEEDMMEISRTLKGNHKETDFNYIDKYSINKEVKEDICFINNGEVDNKIREELKSYRLKVSKSEAIKAYMVFSNDTMEDLIKVKPKTIKELNKVKGFGAVKCDKYGSEIINIILSSIKE